MRLSVEQTTQLTALQKLLGASDVQRRFQGYELLKSLNDTAIAAVLAEGVSLNEEGDGDVNEDQIVRAVARNQEDQPQQHVCIEMLHVKDQLGEVQGGKLPQTLQRT